MALGSTQLLTEMWVPGAFPGGKGGRCVRLITLPSSCAVVMKSGNLNFLEPSGPLQACNGAALHFLIGKCPAYNFGWRRISCVYRGFLQRVPATSDGLKSLSEPQWPRFPTHATWNIHTFYVTYPNFRHLTLTCKTCETRHLFMLYLSTLAQHTASTIQHVTGNWLRKAVKGSGNGLLRYC